MIRRRLTSALCPSSLLLLKMLLRRRRLHQLDLRAESDTSASHRADPPSAAAASSSRPSSSSAYRRNLEDTTTADTTYDCPAGCPAKVCECFLEDSAYDATCYDALIDSCNDGSYVGRCSGTDVLYRAYATVGCSSYTCLDRMGLFDPAAEYNCDVTDPDCGGCYCEYYASVCDTFTPICDGGSDSYFCYDLDYVCAKRECCAQYGPESCILDDFYDTVQPNPAAGGNEVVWTSFPWSARRVERS